jgi:hypothetical protein
MLSEQGSEQRCLLKLTAFMRDHETIFTRVELGEAEPKTGCTMFTLQKQHQTTLKAYPQH